jgi:hypothetical protein
LLWDEDLSGVSMAQIFFVVELSANPTSRKLAEHLIG